MGFSSRKRISHRPIYFLVLWLCRDNGAKTDFKIYRGERDIFTNPGTGTHSESRSTNSCLMYNAECTDGDKCDYCRCSEGKNTLIINDGSIKECVRDEEIVPESVPEDRFWLKNSVYNECLKLNGNPDNQVIGTNCSSPTLDMFWIWTENEQLLNVKNLKCMDRQGKEEVIMKQCQSTRKRQNISCTEHKKGVTEMNIITTANRFLHLNQSKSRVIFMKHANGNNDSQQWSSEKQNLCETSAAYNGCYRFSDDSFLKYLAYDTTESKSPILSISAPILKKNRRCKISEKFNYSRDNYTGESVTANVFSFRNKNKTIKFKTKEVFRAWNGSLLKLFVNCGNETHCALVKLASKPSFSEVINNATTPSRITRPTETTTVTESTTGSNQDNTTSYSGSSEVVTTESKTVEKTNTEEARTAPINSISSEQDGKGEKSPQPPHKSKTPTTGKPPKSKRKQESASGGTNVTAIAVTVPLFVIALVLAIGFLIYRRRRKRAQVPQKSNNGSGIVNYSVGTYEDPYEMYETLKDHENAISHHDVGSPSHAYTSPHSNIVANSTSKEQEYTYAQEKDFPRSSVGNKPEAKKQMNNSPVYETLDQQGNPDDSFYHYPENIITKSPASELEYAYAKDTDIPKVGVDKTEVPKETMGKGVYHTLEQEQPPATDLYKQPDTNIPSELEYSYAKDTDIPRITVDKKISEKPANNAVYQTLEKEQRPSTDLYKQPDTNIPSELEYSYAKDTDIPRITVDKTMSEKPANNAVHQTSEKEQPPSTVLYQQPDTNIPSELEYSYAKNTDIPRITVDKTMSEKPANNAVHQTLEKEPPPSTDLYKQPDANIPTELEYAYAKNTEIPRISVDAKAKRDSVPVTVTEQRDEHSTPQNDSALYHTLEETKVPQPPVYSTLEG